MGQIILTVLIFGTSVSDAGTAAYFPGESRIVRAGDGSLHVFHPETKSEEEMELPEQVLGKRFSLTASAEQLMMADTRSVFSLQTGEKAWELRWSAPAGVEITDIAFDPKNNRLLVVATDGENPPAWWVLESGSGTAKKIFNRRASGAVLPVFDSGGSVYFTVRGDVWKGTIEANEDDEPAYYLEAVRLWPLALKETSDGNSGSSAAREIVPLENWLVLELSRDGGSGWGDIVRVPNVNPYEEGLPLKWEALADCPLGSSAALSPDGKRAAVFLRGAGEWHEIDVGSGFLKGPQQRK